MSTGQPASLIQHINTPADWRRVVLDPESDKTLVFDFYAQWCGPCKAMVPILEQLAAEFKERGVAFFKVDSDQLPDLSSQQYVSALPTFVIYRHGERIGHYVGANPKGLRDKILSCI